MFERFTEKARRVIFFARFEASQYGSPYIESEHLLLGLAREDELLLGLLAAVAIAAIGRALLPSGLGVPVPWFSVVLAIGVSCLTGILFGYLPANRAAKLQPTESLRYE